MDIRRATSDDLGQIASLLDAAGLPQLSGNLPLANVLVALRGAAVIGVIALEVRGLRGLVRSVAVEPSHSRQGLGTSLLQSLLARAQELSLRELYLLTEGAERFFEKAGFVAVPRDTVPAEIRSSREYREQCPDSATVMRLRLVTRHV
jgi:N-acetylglutamate synthase-like GNAT family acetyltransferase